MTVSVEILDPGLTVLSCTSEYISAVVSYKGHCLEIITKQKKS